MSRLAGGAVVVVLLLAGLGWPARSALVAYYSFDDRTLIASLTRCFGTPGSNTLLIYQPMLRWPE